jgi:prolyl 4-hydroxylase
VSVTARPKLADYIRWYDDALPADLCARLVAGFEDAAHRHAPHGRGYERGLEQSSWTELDITPLADDGMKGFFIAQIEKYLRQYNESVPLTIPLSDYGSYQPLRIKRYRASGSDAFQTHFDALGNLSHRYLVFLWYLNDVAEGGETEFGDLGIRIAARTGRLLVFPPYWMYQHAGLPPISNDKYIISTYLLFPPDAGANEHPVRPV